MVSRMTAAATLIAAAALMAAHNAHLDVLDDETAAMREVYDAAGSSLRRMLAAGGRDAGAGAVARLVATARSGSLDPAETRSLPPAELLDGLTELAATETSRMKAENERGPLEPLLEPPVSATDSVAAVLAELRDSHVRRFVQTVAVADDAAALRAEADALAAAAPPALVAAAAAARSACRGGRRRTGAAPLP